MEDSGQTLYKHEMPKVSGFFDAYLVCFYDNGFAIKRESVSINEIFELEHTSPNASYHPYSKPISLTVYPAVSSTNERNVICSLKYGEKKIEVLGNVGNGNNITHMFTCEESGIKNEEFTLTVNCTCNCSVAYQVMKQDFSVFYDFWYKDFFNVVYKTLKYALTAKTNKDKMVCFNKLITNNYNKHFLSCFMLHYCNNELTRQK